MEKKDGWVKLEELTLTNANMFYDRSTCEHEKGTCVRRPEGFFSRPEVISNDPISVYIDDLNNPITESRTLDVPEDVEQEEFLSGLELEEGETVSVNDSVIVITKIVGYSQKFSHLEGVVDSDKVLQFQISETLQQQKQEAQAFLDSTDWLVLKYLRHQALGRTSSMTEEDYLQLEQQRQEAADKL